MRGRRGHIVSALVIGLCSGAGCAAEGPDDKPARVVGDWGDDTKYPDIGGAYAALTPLVGTCTFTASSGLLEVDAGSTAQTILIGKRAVDSVILVNGETCGSPAVTSRTLKRLNVTATTGNQVLVLDFLHGLFATGTAALPGITIDLGGGTDDVRIRGTSGNDTFTFGADGVAINTDNYRDITTTGVENFSISMASGNDVFTGGGGRGTGAAFAGALTVFGGEGNDTLTGGDGVDEINGGPGKDVIAGGAGNDTLNGDEGDDTFDQGTEPDGADVISGGDGIDIVSYGKRTNAVSVTIGAGADDGESGENDAIDGTCEGATGGSGDDTLVGDANDNILSGGPGNDILRGGDGNDVLNGDAGDDVFDEGATSNGSDTFNGGAGTDRLDYSARTADLVVTMGDNLANDGEANEQDNVKNDVEDIVGGSGDDQLTGNKNDNVMTGGLGDDILRGEAGNDTFLEGAVDSGSDIFIGGAGVDTVDYSLRTGNLTITMDGAAADDGLAGEGDDVRGDVEGVLCGSGDDDVTGNDLDNFIDGGDGEDTLFGLGGADVLSGGDDDDVLHGGDGNDTLDGGGGDNDLICGAGDDIAFNQGGGTRADDCEL